MPMGPEAIDNIYGYHPPADLVMVKRHEQVRETYAAFAKFLDLILPDSREKSTAMTNLRQSSMWANASIAMLSPVAELNRPSEVIEAPVPEEPYVETDEDVPPDYAR